MRRKPSLRPLPVTYTNVEAAHWEPFATLVLEAAYEGTLLAAVVNERRGARDTTRFAEHQILGSTEARQFLCEKDGIAMAPPRPEAALSAIVAEVWATARELDDHGP